MIDHCLLEIANLRQQEMLQQAEAERLYRQLKKNRAGFLKQIGRCLLVATRHLEAYSKSSPATPIFDRR
jgi:hypothetical protein